MSSPGTTSAGSPGQEAPGAGAAGGKSSCSASRSDRSSGVSTPRPASSDVGPPAIVRRAPGLEVRDAGLAGPLSRGFAVPGLARGAGRGAPGLGVPGPGLGGPFARGFAVPGLAAWAGRGSAWAGETPRSNPALITAAAASRAGDFRIARTLSRGVNVVKF